VLAGKYKAQIVKRDKISVRVLSTPDHAAGAKAWAEEAAQSLATLSTLLTPLDVTSYGMAEMRVRNRERSYNYEADGFSVYDGVLFDGRAPDARKIAHEVAHAWFGGAVDASGAGERFLTEGMAEHAAWRCVEARLGAEAATQAAFAGIQRYAGSPGEEKAVAETDFGAPRYTQVVYAKGAFALRTLRDWIGNVAFDAAINEYIAGARKRGGRATLDDLYAALRAKGGAAVDMWNEDWLRRGGTPRYEVEIVERGPGRVRGKLVQSGAVYRNPVEIELRGASGKSVSVRVTPSALETMFEADADQRIESSVVDPKALVLFERGRRGEAERK
jgi:aminopeptidase N